MEQKKTIFFSFIIGLICLVVGVFSLSHYGANWDESTHFGRGYAVLYYFLTGKKDYEDLKNHLSERRSAYQINSYTYSFFEEEIDDAVKNKKVNFAGGGHPITSDVLAASLNFIFYKNLNFLGDVEAYHLYSVFVSAVLIGFIFFFVASEYNIFAGFLAAISLGFFPAILGESRFNIKDIPQAVFYTLTVLTFYKGIVSQNWKWIFSSCVFFGLALGTKLNVIFLPFVIVPWVYVYYSQSLKKEGFLLFISKRKGLFFLFLLYPIIGFLIVVGSWPILWPDLWNRLLTIFIYYKAIGFTNSDPSFITLFGFNFYAGKWILYTTPLPTFFLWLFGVVYTIKFWKKEKNKTSLLILLFFLVPILRVSLPNTAIYGGARQIIEYIPAMAILSGIGATYAVSLLHGFVATLLKRFKFSTMKQWSNRIMVVLQLTILLSFIPITLKIISMYPFESIYFNEFIGGLKGAKERNIPGWGNSLGSTYRKGIEWLNSNAEKNARLATVYELRSNVPVMLLREDIEKENSFRSMTKRKGEYIIGVTHEGTYENAFHRKYLERYLDPVYELTVDGVAVLKIWKNDLLHTKQEYKKVEQKITDFSVNQGERTLQIDLKKIVPVTLIKIYYQSGECTLPTVGYFEHSTDGKPLNWKREPGSFAAVPFSTWFRTQPEKGILQYQFAAENTRFIQAVIQDKNSCLLKSPLEIEAYRI